MIIVAPDHVLIHTPVRTPLDEALVRRRDLSLLTLHTQETDSHATGGIRTRNPRKSAAAHIHLSLRRHQDCPIVYHLSYIILVTDSVVK